MYTWYDSEIDILNQGTKIKNMYFTPAVFILGSAEAT